MDVEKFVDALSVQRSGKWIFGISTDQHEDIEIEVNEADVDYLIEVLKSFKEFYD